MKTALSIALLLTFSLHMTGFYLLFSHRQNQVRREMKQWIKQSVPEEALTRIVLLPGDHGLLQWKDQHEFWYRGSLYDVVRCSHLGDTSVYECISDIQETQLFSNLENWIQNTRNRDENGSFLVMVIQISSLFPPPGGIPGIFFAISKAVPPPIFPDTIRSIDPDTPSPPPKSKDVVLCQVNFDKHQSSQIF